MADFMTSVGSFRRLQEKNIVLKYNIITTRTAGEVEF